MLTSPSLVVVPQNCAPREPPCWQAQICVSAFGAPLQFGPDHELQPPPGEVCQMLHNCSCWSVTQSCTRPSFCWHAVTCSTFVGPPATQGGAIHALHVPPGVS